MEIKKALLIAGAAMALAGCTNAMQTNMTLAVFRPEQKLYYDCLNRPAPWAYDRQTHTCVQLTPDQNAELVAARDKAEAERRRLMLINGYWHMEPRYAFVDFGAPPVMVHGN